MYTPYLSFHSRICAAALFHTKRSSFCIRPLLSNRDMNSPGLTVPNSGWNHLTSASALERTGLSPLILYFG